MSETPPESPAILQLIDRAKSGDVEAFSELMEELQPRLLAQAIAFCGNPETARDVVQETMFAAWKSLDRFNGSCRFFTWLYVILLRQHRRSVGWFSRRLPLATADEIETAPRFEADPEVSSVPGTDESELLRSMVAALPTKQRDVLRLRYYAGATESEIAASLGISPGTVKSRLHHGLRKLRLMKEKVNALHDAAHEPQTKPR